MSTAFLSGPECIRRFAILERLKRRNYACHTNSIDPSTGRRGNCSVGLDSCSAVRHCGNSELSVTKVAWANPHISFYIDVTEPSGKVTSWGVDAAAPSALAARRWTATSMKAGDVVTVEGFPARNGN